MPLLDLSTEIEALWDDLNSAVQGVLRSGRFIMGPNVKAFEGEMAAYLGVKHVYHQYTVRIPGGKRDEVRKPLADAGVGTMVYYPVPVHRLLVYAGPSRDLPAAEAASRETLSLPIWPGISQQVQERVAACLRRALA